MSGYSILGKIIVYAGYKVFSAVKKELKENRERQRKEAELERLRREAELDKFRKEYAIKKEKAVKETRSDETRPKDWDLRRDFVKERDGYQCSECGRTTKLHVHHKTPVSKSPDHSENNLVTLCVYCHAKQPSKGHGERLINSEIATQCEKYNYEKKKSRKNYICSICEETIKKGSSSYVKKSYQTNGWWENPNERICEECLLENPSGYPKKIRKKRGLYKFDYDSKTGNIKNEGKKKSPSPYEWSQQIPELSGVSECDTWKKICDHLRINVEGDSARRRLAKWVANNKPYWPSIPDPE
jgi:hypothetical protein